MRRMRPLAALVVAMAALLALASPGYARAEPFSSYCSAIAEATERAGIVVAVAVIDLASGDRCGVLPDRPFLSASLYKLLVMAEAFRQRAEGDISFSDPLVLEPRHSLDDPPDLRLTRPVTLSNGDALENMIRISGNAEALALRELLGAERVDALPADLEMPDTELGTRWVTTAGDVAHFFEQLYRGEIVDGPSSTYMLELLKGQQIDELIPAAIEDDSIAIAHKTGLLDHELHDAGIVFAPAGDFVLVVLTERDEDLESAYAAIHDVTRVAYGAYAGEAPPAAASAPRDPAPATPAAQVAGVTYPPTQEAVQGVNVEAPSPEAAATRVVERSGGQATTWTGGLMLRTAAALAAIASIALVGLRMRGRSAWARGLLTNAPDLAERSAFVRFRNRGEEEREQPRAVVAPLPGSDADASEIPSERLRRVVDIFRAHGELLEQMRLQFQDELQPLNELLARQRETMHQLMENLEQRLRPLNEYADGEERNLDGLEQEMRQPAGDHVARSFAEYVAQQRKRIAERRRRIDEQRVPFQQYGTAHRDAVEVALARFDGDVQALEETLSEQRTIMTRMLEGMRSDGFVAVKGFLDAREEVLAELASGGITDPGEIGQRLREVRRSVEQMAGSSAHIASLLEATDEADGRLASASPQPRPLASTRPATAGEASSVGRNDGATA